MRDVLRLSLQYVFIEGVVVEPCICPCLLEVRFLASL